MHDRTHAPLQAEVSRRLALLGGLASCLPGIGRAETALSGLPALAGLAPVSLPRTHHVDITLAGRPRRIFVAVPEGPMPAAGHPVLWALDGNTAFPLLAALLQQRAARPDDVRGGLPVVVAVGQPGDGSYDQAARASDYTLPGSDGGQAERFLDLLETTLRPWLAKQLPLDPARHTLFGHSFGGLFTLYAMFSRPGLFQRHVAASPSIWWGNRAILPHRDAYLKRPADDVARRLLVTAGSLEESAAPPTTERQRRQQERRQVSSAREMVASLAGVAGLRAEFKLFDGEDHGSVVLPSAMQAMTVAASPA